MSSLSFEIFQMKYIPTENGEETGGVTDFPADTLALDRVEPVYESLPGWKCPTNTATCWDELPENAKKYLERVCELVQAKAGIISVGPKRAQTFRR